MALVPQAFTVRDFYPRPPGGGRRALLTLENGVVLFLSTPSGWRATSDKYSDHIAEQFLSTPFGWRATDLEFPMEDE